MWGHLFFKELDQFWVHVFEHIADIETNDVLSGEEGLEPMNKFFSMRPFHHEDNVSPFQEVARKGRNSI